MADCSVTWWKRKRVALAAALVALAAFTFLGNWAPSAGLRWGVVKVLHSLGMDRVALGGADLSLFNGALTIRGIVAAPDAGAAFDLGGVLLDFRWSPLASKRVSVETLELDDAEIELRRDRSGWALNGLSLATGSDESSWSYDADRLVLRASRLTIIDGATKVLVHLDELRIDNLRSWDRTSVMRIRLAGRVNGAPLLVDGTAMPFALIPSFDLAVKADGLDMAPFTKLVGVDNLAGKASADLVLGGRVEAKALPVELRGRLSLAKAAMQVDGTRITAAGLTLEADKLEWVNGKGKLAGALKAKGADLAAGSTAIAAADLAWKGNATFAADGSYRTEFTAEAEKLAIRKDATVVEHGRAGASGMVESAAAPGELPPVAGRLDAWADAVTAHEPARELAIIERAEISGLTLSPVDGAIAQRIELKNIKALARRGRADWRIEGRRIILDRPSLNADGDVTIAGLMMVSPLARLTRTKDGLMGFAAGNGEGGTMPAVAVGRVKVAGGRVEFEDRTTSEIVRLIAASIDLTARDLDSRQPERDSPFTMKARVGASALAAKGALRPFAPSFSGRMTGDIKSLELPPLSPYAADTLGVHLHTGHFDGDLSLIIDRGSLDGRMDMVLSNLFVAQPDPNARIAKEADMSVASVLDLLRDSEDRIRLTIPVRGDLANPDFDVSDAVSQAVGGALKSTLITTLKVAFPVVALIGYVIDGDSSTRLSLEPLAFVPGGAELTAPHRAKLSNVADLLRQRPAVALTLCGIASQPEDWPQVMQAKREEELGLLAKLQNLVGSGPKPADTPPDRDALAALADKRAQAVKAWLVEDGGIEAGRLFTCRPQVDGDGKGAPRVDLLL